MKVTVDSRLKELVPNFINRKKTELKEMIQMIQDQEFEKLRLMGRSLAWSAPGYGFIELGLMAKKLEQDATVRRGDLLPHYRENMLQYLDNLEIEYVEVKLEA